MDKKTLPKGEYKDVGFESRQVVDIEVSRVITINGKRVWLHCVSNPLWSYYLPHEKRGLEAMRNGCLASF